MKVACKDQIAKSSLELDQFQVAQFVQLVDWDEVVHVQLRFV